MKTWTHARVMLAAAVLLSILTGCAQLKKSPAKEEAKARWEQMRAKVRLQLAERNFESGKVEDALKLSQEVISLDPASLDGYLLLGRIQLEKGQIAEAESVLDAATALNKASPELDYLRGMLAERRELREDAADWYKRAYEAQPNEADYLVAYVESLMVLEDLDTVVDLLTKRQQDFEQDLRVQVLLGQALGMAGRHRESSDAYLSVLRLAPEDPALREEAGLALLAAGRVSEAQSVLEPLLKDSKSKPSTNVVLALASAMLESNQAQRAIALLEPITGSNTQSFTLWLLLGKAYLTVDRPVQALEAAKRARSLKPDSLDAQLLVACCDLAAGNRTDALNAAQDIVTAHPGDPVAMALLEEALKPNFN